MRKTTSIESIGLRRGLSKSPVRLARAAASIALSASALVSAFAPAAASASSAATSPLSASGVPPVQFPARESAVAGARLSILWGRHRSVYGLDVGLLGNVTDQRFAGLAIAGLFNVTTGQTTVLGLQLAGVANVNAQTTNVYGLQLAGLVNSNGATSSVVGLQAALLANLSEFTTVYGMQIGLYNRAQAVYGFQIGLVNVTNSLHGIQIGLANFNYDGIFYVSPLLNVGF